MSTREANQRAERLKAAFGASRGERTTTTSPVRVEAIRAGSLRLTHGGYRTATLSGNGLRTATMALTSGGDSGKTVVYTDRELTRPLLEHYGNHRDTSTGGDRTRFNLAAPTGGPLVLGNDERSPGIRRLDNNASAGHQCGRNWFCGSAAQRRPRRARNARRRFRRATTFRSTPERLRHLLSLAHCMEDRGVSNAAVTAAKSRLRPLMIAG